MAWVHADFCPEREDYVDAAWEAYKEAPPGVEQACFKRFQGMV